MTLHVSYPNAADRARAAAEHLSPGGDIMIHGVTKQFEYLGAMQANSDWTYGCIALSNPELDEVSRLGAHRNADRDQTLERSPQACVCEQARAGQTNQTSELGALIPVLQCVVLALAAILYSGRMALRRMDNVGIVVENLEKTIDFFRELGLELEGRATIEGEWAGRITGLGNQRVEIAMMRTPDGHSRLELSRFLSPLVVADHRNAPVNALGYLRVMFTVDDIDGTLERLRKRGAQLVGEVVQYQDSYRLCYIRGPESLLIGLAQELN